MKWDDQYWIPLSPTSSPTLHIVLTLLFVELTLLLGSCILVLLILRNQVVHVTFRLSELHLVHAFTCVPVEEGFATEHRREVLGYALEHLLNRRGIAEKSDRHLQALRWDVADRAFHVVRDPLDEVRRVLVLYIQHLLVHLLRRHSATEHRSGRKVAAVPRVSRAHHVLGIEHLLRQLRYRQSPVLLGATGGERREARHEEVQAWERDEIYSELPQVAIQLARKSQATGHTTDCSTHQVVQVTVGWCGKLQCAEADVVECLVVEQEAFICVL